MTGPPWERVKSVFAEVMAREPAHRSAFLHHLGENDPSLRDEVASLVASADDSGSFPAARAAIASVAGDVTLHSLLTIALGQQYDIVRSLGQGGMGAVYLARERALERFVAVKVLRPDLANVEDGRERFRREARIVAQLSHPSILPLHTFGEVSGTWYFVMGYVRGMSLAERLRVEGRLPSEEAHRILSELADALECAHQHGVVHRDIKPANVLLDAESGRAVLADFGISKVGVRETASPLPAWWWAHHTSWRPSRRSAWTRSTRAATSTRLALWDMRCSPAASPSPAWARGRSSTIESPTIPRRSGPWRPMSRRTSRQS